LKKLCEAAGESQAELTLRWRDTYNRSNATNIHFDLSGFGAAVISANRPGAAIPG